MVADPELSDFLEGFERLLSGMYASWAQESVAEGRPESASDCLHADILTLGCRLLGADVYGQRTERAFISEMLTLLKPLQPNMPYDYNLTLTDALLETELGQSCEITTPSAELTSHLWCLRMFEAWVANHGETSPDVADFVQGFQSLLTRLVSHDGHFSKGEESFLSAFDAYFARYRDVVEQRSSQSF